MRVQNALVERFATSEQLQHLQKAGTKEPTTLIEPSCSSPLDTGHAAEKIAALVKNQNAILAAFEASASASTDQRALVMQNSRDWLHELLHMWTSLSDDAGAHSEVETDKRAAAASVQQGLGLGNVPDDTVFAPRKSERQRDRAKNVAPGATNNYPDPLIERETFKLGRHSSDPHDSGQRSIINNDSGAGGRTTNWSYNPSPTYMTADGKDYFRDEGEEQRLFQGTVSSRISGPSTFELWFSKNKRTKTCYLRAFCTDKSIFKPPLWAAILPYKFDQGFSYGVARNPIDFSVRVLGIEHFANLQDNHDTPLLYDAYHGAIDLTFVSHVEADAFCKAFLGMYEGHLEHEDTDSATDYDDVIYKSTLSESDDDHIHSHQGPHRPRKASYEEVPTFSGPRRQTPLNRVAKATGDPRAKSNKSSRQVVRG